MLVRPWRNDGRRGGVRSMAGRKIFGLSAVSTRVGATLAAMQKPKPGVPTPDQIRRAPKVLLHDHLDGGLRPGTVVDIARATGYDALPETDPDKLGRWFRDAAD